MLPLNKESSCFETTCFSVFGVVLHMPRELIVSFTLRWTPHDYSLKVLVSPDPVSLSVYRFISCPVLSAVLFIVLILHVLILYFCRIWLSIVMFLTYIVRSPLTRVLSARFMIICIFVRLVFCNVELFLALQTFLHKEFGFSLVYSRPFAVSGHLKVPKKY